jgi:hypothetical protein
MYDNAFPVSLDATWTLCLVGYAGSGGISEKTNSYLPAVFIFSHHSSKMHHHFIVIASVSRKQRLLRIIMYSVRQMMGVVPGNSSSTRWKGGYLMRMIVEHMTHSMVTPILIAIWRLRSVTVLPAGRAPSPRFAAEAIYCAATNSG